MRKLKLMLGTVLAALCTLLLPSLSCASGVYLGGGIGYATLEDRPGTPSGLAFDESDTAYRAFGGYRFDWLPIVSVSGEVGYRQAGQPSTGALNYEASGVDYSLLGGLGLGPVELFARVGRIRYDLDKAVGSLRNEFDGSAALYGIGARFSLFGLGVRAEYEKIDIDELDNLGMLSLSAFFEF